MSFPFRWRTLLATILVAILTSAFLPLSPAAAAPGDFTITAESKNEGTGASPTLYRFTVSVEGPYVGQVSYTINDGTARAGEDYTDPAGDNTLIFLPGDTTETIDVPVTADAFAEPNETFSVTITPTPGSCDVCTATATIINDDGSAPDVTVAPATVTEGTALAQPATADFVVTLSKAPAAGQTVSVFYDTASGTAIEGTDFTATSGTLTFTSAGPLTQTVKVPVAGDATDEPNETFTLAITPSNANCDPCSAVGTITDDDGPPTVTITDATRTEGNAGAADLVFTVSLSAASGNTVTVSYNTVNGTATAGSDYVAESDSLTFAPGETSKTVGISVAGDTTNEANETFTVVLSSPTAATLAEKSTGTGTINNDDAVPALSVNDVTVAEGNAGSTTARFTVSLSAPSGQAVTVHYATANGTATAGTDYTAATGDLTFAPGETTKTVDVAIAGDLLNELNEAFTLNLTAPVNATIADPTGTGTITNDDAVPTLSINDATVTEGNAGSTTATFTVTLSAASGRTVTVDYATSNGTATAGSDYTAVPTTTLTFEPGQTTKTVDVTVLSDTVDEPNETFNVTLSNPTAATIADGTGVGTITDDDSGPSFAISDATVTETDGIGATLVFTVTKTGSTALEITVPYSTADGTAVAGEDYTSESLSVVFAPGETTKQIVIDVTGDNVSEDDETMFVNLGTPTSGTVTDGQGVGTIIDDEPNPPALSIADAAIVEGTGGTTNLVFTVTATNSPNQGTITFNYTTQSGTATAGTDFTATSGVGTIASTASSTTITVPITTDNIDEANETFTVVLSNVRNATLSDGTATGTINDDDAAPTISAAATSVTEGTGASADLVYTVSLSNPSASVVTVNYATSDGSATAGADYTGTSGTLTFQPGVTTGTVTVAVTGDSLDEAAETVLLTLSAASGGTVGGTNPAVGTINDDDAAPSLEIGNASVLESDAGAAGTTTATFTVTLSAASGQTVTVTANTADGSAKQPGDYTAIAPTTVTFNPGETVKTVAVTVKGDTVDEANETFNVVLTNAVNASVTDDTGVATITDDDANPSFSIGDSSVAEGNTGTTPASFTITRTGATEHTYTVQVDTVNGTASAPNDFTAITTSVVTFAPGDSTKTVTVNVKGDLIDEANETYTVVLSNPSDGSTLGDASGLGTITDDDPAPSITVQDIVATEGNSGTTNAKFTLTLSNPSSSAITVSVATADGTATSADYTPLAATTVTFAAGETTKDVLVAVKGDVTDEANETFVLNLSAPTNATIGDNQATATITDDDGVPTVSVSDASATEGNSGTKAVTFTITLSNPSSQPVTVNFATVAGTATTGVDYRTTSGTAAINPGQTSTTFAVDFVGDTTDEANETFSVVLSSPTNATIADGTGAGTITDDDEPATPTPAPQGYSLVGEDGSLYAFGTAKNFGDRRGVPNNAPIIGVAYTPGGNGYWLVAKDGGIFTFGDADFFGSMGDKKLNSPVIGMAATPTGKGYWLFAGDGGIFTFGDAEFFGSMGDKKLNAPVINMEPLASGRGYWLVAADGGIFTFGLGDFFGSMGDQKLNQPVFDMTSTDSDRGYWLVARDGGIFSFGDAEPKFFGSAVNETPRPTKVIGMDSTPGSQGYWIADASGKIYRFGDAQDLGDRSGSANPAPMVAFATVPSLKQ